MVLTFEWLAGLGRVSVYLPVLDTLQVLHQSKVGIMESSCALLQEDTWETQLVVRLLAFPVSWKLKIDFL